MPDGDAYDAESVDEDSSYYQHGEHDEGYGDEGIDDDYDFERAGGGFLDGMLFGKIPKKIAYPALGAIAVVLLIIISALTTGGFGFGDGVKKVTITFPHSPFDDEDLYEVEIKVYISRETFAKDYTGKAKVSVKYEGANDSDETHLDDMKINDGIGRGTYKFEDFYVDNGFYQFTVTAGGVSDTGEIEIKKTAKALKPNFGIFQDYIDSNGDIAMRINFALFAYEGSDALADLVGTTGEGKIYVYYCDSGNPPRMENSQVIATIDFETAFADADVVGYPFMKLSYRIDGGSEQVNDGIRGGAFDFKFNNDWIKNDDNDGNYTLDMEFTNTFGKDPDPETKEGFPRGTSDSADRDRRKWMNNDGDEVFTDE